MENSVYLDDHGFIRNVYNGPQNAASAHFIVDKTQELSLELRKNNKSVLIIVSSNNQGDVDQEGRKVIVEALRTMPFDRIATYGMAPFVRHLADFLFLAAGLSENVRNFDTEEDAIGWLSEYQTGE